MMLNPGQVNPIQGNWGNSGNFAFGNLGGGFGQPQAAYGSSSQMLGSQFGFNNTAQAGNPIDDVADDIAERISTEITDQAATAASALFQSQGQLQSQPFSGLNAKRWLNATRTTDAVQETVKQSVHQICRQVVVQLLNQLHSQTSGAWQQLGGYGQIGGFGQIGQQLGQPGLAAFGGNAALYGQPFQQNVAQLAPVVASILSTLQAHGQGYGSGLGLQGRQN